MGIDVDSTSDEGVSANRHVGDRAGFIPAVGIALDQDSGHAAAFEDVVLHEDFSSRGEEESTAGIHVNFTAANRHVGIPGEVIENVFLFEFRGCSIES